MFPSFAFEWLARGDITGRGSQFLWQASSAASVYQDQQKGDHCLRTTTAYSCVLTKCACEDIEFLLRSKACKQTGNAEGTEQLFRKMQITHPLPLVLTRPWKNSAAIVVLPTFGVLHRQERTLTAITSRVYFAILVDKKKLAVSRQVRINISYPWI